MDAASRRARSPCYTPRTWPFWTGNGSGAWPPQTPAAGRTPSPSASPASAGGLYVPVDGKPKRGDPRALKRLRNLSERPEAVLLVDRYDEDWGRLRWLLVRARTAVLEAGADASGALAALEARYPQYATMGLAALGLPVIALRPTAVRRWTA